MLGKFITFEGIEGAGKSTQIPLIANWLKTKEIPFIVSREPGGTELGEKLRDIFLYDSMHALTELLLVFAARVEHVETVIKPALHEGKWVLCDRFVGSSFAYQGAGRKLGFEKIASLEKCVLNDFQPDLIFWFDLPVETGLKRIQSRKGKDRFECEHQQFLYDVREGYQNYAQRNFNRIQKIHAENALDQVEKDVISHMEAFIQKIRINH